MRYLSSAFAILVLAAACGSGDAATNSPSPTPVKPVPTLDRTPSLLSDVPEGRIIMASGSSGKGYSLAGELAEEIPGGDVFRSPDGARAVFVRRTGPGSFDAIGVLESSEVRIIHEWDTAWYPSVVWSHDGSRFAYSVATDPSDALSPVEIWAADADGTGRSMLMSAPGVYLAGWAADGRLIARGPEWWLGLVRDDGDIEEIPPLPEDDAFDVTLSPRGRRIAVQAGYIEEQAAAQVLHIESLWIYDIAAATWSKAAEMNSDVRRPTTFVSASAALATSARKGPPPVAWSPDGTHIAFTRSTTASDGGAYSWELWLAHLEDGRAERLSADAYQPSWSADSEFVSFVVDDGAGDTQAAYHRLHGETQVLAIDGSGPTRSTAWTSDGRLIISLAHAIRIMDPESGQTTSVLDETGEDVIGANIWGEDQAWSPSGRYVAFGAVGAAFVLDTETARASKLLDSGNYYTVAWLPE